MKMPKCKKTVSGKHYWSEKIYGVVYSEEGKRINSLMTTCIACGLIHDPILVEPKKQP